MTDADRQTVRLTHTHTHTHRERERERERAVVKLVATSYQVALIPIFKLRNEVGLKFGLCYLLNRHTTSEVAVL